MVRLARVVGPLLGLVTNSAAILSRGAAEDEVKQLRRYERSGWPLESA